MIKFLDKFSYHHPNQTYVIQKWCQFHVLCVTINNQPTKKLQGEE